MIERFACRDFTVFDRLSITFSPGINVIIGDNGVGKTHLMKAAYALSSAGAIKREAGGPFEASFSVALVDLFKPREAKLEALCRREASGKSVLAADFSSGRRVSAIFDAEGGGLSLPDDNFPRSYTDDPCFIPSREIASFLRGFVGLYSLYELPFDRAYRDLAVALDLPAVRQDKLREPSSRIITAIERVCGGRFDFRGGGAVTFRSGEEEHSAATASEGLLRLGILARLLENGAIRPGESGPIFWEHPENSMNPKLLKVLAGILLELSRAGAQLILTTHSYVLMKYLDLLRDPQRQDEIRWHSMTRAEGGSVKLDSFDRYSQIGDNSITGTFFNLCDIELAGGEGQ